MTDSLTHHRTGKRMMPEVSELQLEEISLLMLFTGLHGRGKVNFQKGDGKGGGCYL